MAMNTSGMHERMMTALSEKRKFLSGEASKKQWNERKVTGMQQAGATKRTGLQEAGSNLRQGRGFEQQDQTAATSRTQTLADMARQREQTLSDTSSKRIYDQETTGRKAGIDAYMAGTNIPDVARLYGAGEHGVDFNQMSQRVPTSEHVNVPGNVDYGLAPGSVDKATGLHTPYMVQDPVTGAWVKRKNTSGR